MKKQAAEIDANRKNVDSIVAEKVTNQLSVEKVRLYKEAKVEIEKEQEAKTALLEEQLKNKNEKLMEAQKNENRITQR